jgi:hypothetical protein
MRMTPKQKAWLATRDVIDPFNAITILGNSAIYVGANAHSDYGPGMTGFGKNVGVSYSQDVTGEFLGTFLIPSIVHQDPHYHRLPNASMKRRIAHALYQVVWTQGDDGNAMLNYANLAGFAIDDEIGNLYVPGQRTDFKASASRYGIGLALAPVDNFITEFVPDLARRIHVHVVTPKWSDKPLLKSLPEEKPPLGWPRTTDSLCPKCVPEIRQQILDGKLPHEVLLNEKVGEIKAQIIERDGKILMVKDCPKHGHFEDVMSIDTAFFKHLEESFPGRDIRAHNDEKLHNHGTSPSPTAAARCSPSTSPTAAT